MTEKEFKKYLNKLLNKGKIPQVSGRIDSDDEEIQQAGEYMSSHAFLPKDYDKIPESKIIEMGKLLLKKLSASLETKQIIMVILAHYGSDQALEILKKYNENPDNKLKYFARFALDECQMWSEDR
jgi:hypothetical protein